MDITNMVEGKNLDEAFSNFMNVAFEIRRKEMINTRCFDENEYEWRVDYRTFALAEIASGSIVMFSGSKDGPTLYGIKITPVLNQPERMLQLWKKVA